MNFKLYKVTSTGVTVTIKAPRSLIQGSKSFQNPGQWLVPWPIINISWYRTSFFSNRQWNASYHTTSSVRLTTHTCCDCTGLRDDNNICVIGFIHSWAEEKVQNEPLLIPGQVHVQSPRGNRRTNNFQVHTCKKLQCYSVIFLARQNYLSIINL